MKIVTDIRSLVARRIRSWRLKKHFKLCTIARKLGVSESTVSMWETGERFPNPENLAALAILMQAPPCYLVCQKKNADDCLEREEQPLKCDDCPE
jgi:transcriptional regulator with XRE-family HTH domain